MAPMIQEYTATLISKRQPASDIWHYEFSLPEGPRLDFVAGQYLLLKLEERYRQYSIASRDTWHDKFELILETIPQGLGSNYLMNLPIGGKALFKGPAGVFTLKETPKNKIFLATGTGIAPIKAMIESYFEREAPHSSLTLFFGLKNRTGVYLFDEFRAFSTKHPNFNFRVCLSREDDLAGLDKVCYGSGRVNAHLEVFLDGRFNDLTGAHQPNLQAKTAFFNTHEYYICGSKPVVDSLREFVIGLGVLPENIYFERFTI